VTYQEIVDEIARLDAERFEAGLKLDAQHDAKVSVLRAECGRLGHLNKRTGGGLFSYGLCCVVCGDRVLDDADWHPNPVILNTP